MREGFWQSERHPGLPFPMDNGPWEGQQEFISALAGLESAIRKDKAEGGELVRFRGISTCRICRKPNGNAEFRYARWSWPDGFIHYVMEHNVRPSLAFQEFILRKEL